MANLFETRTTEFFRNEEGFLSVVTPEPLFTFLHKPAQEDRLYDRLTVIIGTSGSGKTTLARLFQYQTVKTLLRNGDCPNRDATIDALTSCGALSNAGPTLLGCRIPLGAEYRDFWELPYPDRIKTGLMIALLQARALLSWLRNVKASGVPIDRVSIEPRADASAALATIGGTRGPELHRRAQEVELATHRISSALLPPRIEDVLEAAVAPYRPFDVIKAFRITDEAAELRPLVIFDDAHALHPAQLKALRDCLARRELRIARWVLTRLDAFSSASVLTGRGGPSGEPGLDRARATTVIWMQGGSGRDRDRPCQRRAFRKMSKAMAGRYLSGMEVFNRRGLNDLGALLPTLPHSIPPGQREELARRVDSLQRECRVSPDRRRSLERTVDRFLENADDSNEDLRLATLAVLFERHAKRIPLQGPFHEANRDAEPNRLLKVDAGVVDGARVHLLHEFGRPYYYGVDTLCDASWENAEQFLRLTARLVEHLQTQLIRREEASLASRTQHKLLQERAVEMIEDWAFPECGRVRALVHGMATACLAKSLDGDAPLRGEVNAFGIPQDDFDAIPRSDPELARVLQFGVAYNAISLLPNHATTNTTWCLIELGGIPILRYGLTLKRGGFLERRASDLKWLLSEERDESATPVGS